MAIQIVILILSFSIVLLFANSILLKPLYYVSVENDMEKCLIELSKINYFDENEKWIDEIALINHGQSYDIAIQYNEKIIYTSRKVMPIIFRKLDPGWKTLSNGIIFGISIDKRRNTELFIAKYELENGVTITLTQGLEPILKSVNQSNILLIAITSIFLLITILVVFKLSKNRKDENCGIGLSIFKAIQEVSGCEYGCYNKDGYVSFWFDVGIEKCI